MNKLRNKKTVSFSITSSTPFYQPHVYLRQRFTNFHFICFAIDFFVIDAVVALVIQFPAVIYAKKGSFSLFYLSRILRFCSKSYYPGYIEVFFLAFIISLS